MAITRTIGVKLTANRKGGPKLRRVASSITG
jgi:hypothetical protein